jgi:hypothetical protein
MEDCSRRQVERRGDETAHRCVHSKADTFGTIVESPTCAACPLRVFIEKKKEKPTPHMLPVLNDDPSAFPSCEFRHSNRVERTCGMTNLPVTAEHCNRCAKDTVVNAKTIMGKVISYATAVRKWTGAGMPTRTQEEIEQLYDEHCSKCSMYDKVNGVCNSCGCPANKDQPAIRNKLKMATEQCPLGRFPAKVQANV